MIKKIIKSKEIQLLMLIDILFYTYLIFGLFILSYIGYKYYINDKIIAISYIAILLPLFWLKAYKEHRKNNISRIVFDA